jgi:peptide chain release factor subunit 1
MLTQQLSSQLDRLASFEASPFPVVSLYLDMRPDEHGRDRFEPFLRKELAERLETFPAAGPERESLDRDAERIRGYLGDVDRSANGLALFACSAGDLFEAMPLSAPITEHRMYIADRPHLYPLAYVIDAYPRAAFLLANTNSARLFVVAANSIEKVERVESAKSKRHKVGGWSQARFQRHVDNFRQQHAKEVVDVLTRVVRNERIGSIVIAGDEVVVPMLREHFPKDIAEKLIDVVKLDVRAPEHEILEVLGETLRKKDAESDRESVERLFDEYRGDGLAVVGVKATRQALAAGQVDQLVITSAPETIDAGSRGDEEKVAEDLIAKARQTAASIRFIEDAALLQAVGGVGAFLRFRL